MKFYLLAVLLISLLAGCQTSEPVREVYAGETRIETFSGVGVNIEGRLNEDGGLDPAPFVGQFLPNQEMTIVGARATTTPSGMPKVQFSIENRKDKTQAFQYRFTWMDRDGFVVMPDQNPWQTLHLAGREVAAVESVAQSEKARAFRLIIRPLDFKK
jgi:uncharacterized protein YcfL